MLFALIALTLNVGTINGILRDVDRSNKQLSLIVMEVSGFSFIVMY